jgi:hypothetical protein
VQRHGNSRAGKGRQDFGSLVEPERAKALRLLAQEITNRYQEPSGPFSIT